MERISTNNKRIELEKVERELDDEGAKLAVKLLNMRKTLSSYAVRFLNHRLALASRAKQLNKELSEE